MDCRGRDVTYRKRIGFTCGVREDKGRMEDGVSASVHAVGGGGEGNGRGRGCGSCARFGGLEVLKLFPQLLQLLLQLLHGSVVALAHSFLVIAQNRHLQMVSGRDCIRY